MLDEGPARRGGGDGGGEGKDCVDRLSQSDKDAMVGFVIGKIDDACMKMAEHYRLCPCCALDVMMLAAMSFVVDKGHIDYEDVLSIFQHTFSKVFKEQGVSIAAIAVDLELKK